MALGDVVLGAAPLGGFMALKVTAVTQPTSCEHRLITVDDEGVSRSFRSTYAELDTIIDAYPTLIEAKRAFVLMWLAYRRRVGRTVINVDIA